MQGKSPFSGLPKALGSSPCTVASVASVHDADTFRCADGTRIRVAAINAREVDGSGTMNPAP